MENRITALITEYLAREHIQSKKQMASVLGVRYRSLLNACSGKCSRKCHYQIVETIIQYCVANGIRLDAVPPNLYG